MEVSVEVEVALGDGVELRSGVLDMSVALLLLTSMMPITVLFVAISLSLLDLSDLFNNFVRMSSNISFISSLNRKLSQL